MRAAAPVTFDTASEILVETVTQLAGALRVIGSPVYLNRDVEGRFSLIVRSGLPEDRRSPLRELAERMGAKLLPHVLTDSDGRAVIFEEDDLQAAVADCPRYRLVEDQDIWIVDRLTHQDQWALGPRDTGADGEADGKSRVPRIVFYSVKGGVGRTTACIGTARLLADAGHKVLLFDLDLESPGLTSALDPSQAPKFGAVDWMVEDLLGNGESLVESCTADVDTWSTGRVTVVPAYGSQTREYISKLGRVWMPAWVDDEFLPWSHRLGRFISRVEQVVEPDFTFIDSRAGLDEVASACIMSTRPSLVLMFGSGNQQSWDAYRLLMKHWQQYDRINVLRDSLQVVAALMPARTDDRDQQLAYIRETAWDAFRDLAYDNVEPGNVSADEVFSFDLDDQDAPHWPWPVLADPALSYAKSPAEAGSAISALQAQAAFGDLAGRIKDMAAPGGPR